MPDQSTIKRARQDAREGKSPSTQAGEFVREEFHHIREGEHGARSTKQAIAIGLSKARRAGVKLSTPPPGQASAKVRPQASRDSAPGKKGRTKPSPRRSRASLNALKKEGHAAASHPAISRQTHQSAGKRSAADRSRSARKAAATRGGKP